MHKYEIMGKHTLFPPQHLVSHWCNILNKHISIITSDCNQYYGGNKQQVIIESKYQAETKTEKELTLQNIRKTVSRQRTQQVQGPPVDRAWWAQEEKVGQGGVQGWRSQGPVVRLGWGLRILSCVQGKPLTWVSSGSAAWSPFRLGAGAQGCP